MSFLLQQKLDAILFHPDVRTWWYRSVGRCVCRVWCAHAPKLSQRQMLVLGCLQGLGDEEELEVSEVRKIWRGQYSKVKASQEAIYVN